MTQMIKRFERNTKGREFTVGDIHGCFTKLRRALSALGFNDMDDRLFSVGDLTCGGAEPPWPYTGLRIPRR